MAVAAPARKTAPAPPPSRTKPPRKKASAAPAAPARRKAAAAPAAPARRPRDRPSPRGRAAAAPATAPARKAPARRAPARAPQRAKPGTKKAARGQLIPIAVGRTAATVRHLPDSGLMVRMTRGRLWIGVLGVLLAGIVGLNVVTLSFAASSGKIDEAITSAEQEQSIVSGRASKILGIGSIRIAAAEAGLLTPPSDEILFIQAGHDDVAKAAARLSALGSG